VKHVASFVAFRDARYASAVLFDSLFQESRINFL